MCNGGSGRGRISSWSGPWSRCRRRRMTSSPGCVRAWRCDVLAVDLSDPSVVSPGIAGFITVFLLALALLVLLRSMVGHLRKVRYQAEREAAAEKAASEREASVRSSGAGSG